MRPRVSFATMRPVILIAMILIANAGAALAQPRPMPPQPLWDSRGWVLLGERTVNGRYDRDRIEVGRYDGKYNKLTMVVDNSDLELIDFRVEFGDRTEYHPRLSHIFRDGQRTRVIDLPPSEAVIQRIDIRYKNLPGGGDARVQVWGWRIGAPVPPPAPAPPPVRHSWDTRGWMMLGARQVNGRYDHDRIEVGRYDGRFSRLTMAVEDSDLELIDFRIEFDDRTEYHPRLSHFFREGQRTQVIDLPPSEHTIRVIDIRYKNTPGGGPASVEIWGQRDGGAPPAPPAPPPAPAWDNRGWTLLGERHVDSSRQDSDKIDVPRWERRFRKLTVVVLDGDLEMIDLAIKFRRGEPFHPPVNAIFRENTRTKVIDLPRDERAVQWIEFKYRNLPGTTRARVQLWAQ